jgi:asparaginyl-tRNA synthetase
LRIQTILTSESGIKVRARGWVRTRRDSRDISFIEINDGSCLENLQAVVDHGLEGLELARLTVGSSCVLDGNLVDSPAKGQRIELKVDRVRVVGDADPETYPLQKKRHSFEFLREIAHLRPRTNTFGAVNRIRNILAREVHGFFQEREFIYIQTPIITSSDCEGAGEMFRVVTPDEKGNLTDEFFGTRTGLTVSGQLEAELMALALGNVYTFGPTFRAENSNTSRHLSEFWMVEPEMAFAELEDVIELAIECVRHLFRSVLDDGRTDMEFFDERIAPGKIDTLTGILSTELRVVTYTEAIEALRGSGRTFEFEPRWGEDLQSEHEKYLTGEWIRGPVAVIDYPASIKPFYMKLNDDGKTVRAMDLLIPGVGEIIGGSQREERLDVLTGRMEESGIEPEEYRWYLDSRRFGSVPHAGFGLGFERMVQFVTGMQNIRDVIPFPRTPGNASF